jgi:hypothetical protein
MEGIDTASADEREWWQGTKSRIFISCGQRDTFEKDTARRIRSAVRDLGFCPYMAFEMHSSKSLTEGIYEHLRTAEYFLFVDFARDRLGWRGPRRGSLFSNQELAIASFLNVDSLFFVEKSIVKREGILGVIQGNPVGFTRSDDLPNLVRTSITDALWDVQERHEVRIEEVANAVDLAALGGVVPAQYFHLGLRNHSRKTFGSNCMVQVLGIRNVTTGTSPSTDIVEMKFKHITWPIVGIAPASTRQFDAMFIQVAKPSEAILGILSQPYIDSGSIIGQHTLAGPGDFEVDIVAYSREFRPDRATMLVHLGTRVQDAKMTLKKVGA